MDWTEIIIEIGVKDVDLAGDIANMTVPYGIYIEDYSNLEREAREIARINLIDEELLNKSRDKALIHVYISPDESPAEAIAFLSERYNAAGIRCEISQKRCRDEDWENNWKRYFKPLPVGKKLLIRPLWVDEYEPAGRTVLHLEPGVAFGTGTHETTRLCLETLESYVGADANLLDIGCGSGILSVAALLLGAKSAVAVDIDSLAVKMAAENGRLNGFLPPVYTVLEGNLTDRVSGLFDVVAANIVADAIVTLSRDVAEFMKPGGVFIASGIIDSREGDVLGAFQCHGFEVVERRELNGWLCFVAKHSGGAEYVYTAEHYDLLVRENNDPFRDTGVLRRYMDNWDGAAFIDAMELTPRGRVLEIGVGTGRLAEKVLKKGCAHFTGIDLSPLTIERAEENLSAWANVTLINGDFLEHVFNERFDVIYASLTFFHIENKRAAVEKVASLLNKGGRFVLSVPREKETEIDFGTRKIRLYPDDAENIRALAEASGLEFAEMLHAPFADIIVTRK
ncbi:MAG: 50S ribosomal protein L11 methyltransferase [Oscillospiraceae bacterium]|nr:50S ribosomal protein L11 methyltransferase [Oscillospiraceae bacterium]